MPITIEEVLREFGDHVSVDEFAAALHESLSARQKSSTTALTDNERTTLMEFGGIGPDFLRSEDGPQAVQREATSALDVVRDSLTVATAASRLGLSTSRVLHRIGDNSLYAIKFGGHRYIPEWQFDTEEALLPGLRTVLAALPQAVHPLTVAGFMTTPQGDLFIDGAPQTPREWLRSGRSPHAVAHLMADIIGW